MLNVLTVLFTWFHVSVWLPGRETGTFTPLKTTQTDRQTRVHIYTHTHTRKSKWCDIVESISQKCCAEHHIWLTVSTFRRRRYLFDPWMKDNVNLDAFWTEIGRHAVNISFGISVICFRHWIMTVLGINLQRFWLSKSTLGLILSKPGIYSISFDFVKTLI